MNPALAASHCLFRIPTNLGRGLFLALALLPLRLGGAQPADDLAALDAREAAQCMQNLRDIHAAIQAYRREHKDIPRQLDGLIPRFISDVSILQCPACVRANTTSPEIEEKSKNINPRFTYTYEFREAPIPQSISGGSTRTMREFKRLQMTILGSAVPLLRCHCHSRSINLTFGGDIHDGPKDWEDAHLDVARIEDLSFARLFAEFTVFKMLHVPPRSADTPPQLIDLSDHYNASLDKGWHSDPHNNLASLPSGKVEFAGVPFDVRGIVQLTGAKLFELTHYPVAASNLVVGLRTRSLHFLHATAHSVDAGVKIGSYVIHYVDGQTAEFPIRYGRHLLDWWSDPNKEGRFAQAEDSRVAWTGTNPKRQADGKKIYLYQTRWQHPHPELNIKSLDFISAMEASAPFLIAVTADANP